MRQYFQFTIAFFFYIFCNISCNQVPDSHSNINLKLPSDTLRNLNLNTFKKVPLSAEYFSGKVFIGGTRNVLDSNCQFVFACDCCKDIFMFDKDSSFYYFSNCVGDELFTGGIYYVDDDSLILNYNGYCVMNRYNWEFDSDTTKNQFLIEDSIGETSRVAYLARKCNNEIITEHNSEFRSSILRISSLKVDSMIKYHEHFIRRMNYLESINISDCVFDNDLKKNTVEWLTKLDLKEYFWDYELQVAKVLLSSDTAYLSRGGCYHFGLNFERKYFDTAYSIQDVNYWAKEAHSMAEKFGFEYVAYKMIENDFLITNVSDNQILIEIEDDDPDDNKFYPGIELTKTDDYIHMNIHQYSN